MTKKKWLWMFLVMTLVVSVGAAAVYANGFGGRSKRPGAPEERRSARFESNNAGSQYETRERLPLRGKRQAEEDRSRNQFVTLVERLEIEGKLSQEQADVLKASGRDEAKARFDLIEHLSTEQVIDDYERFILQSQMASVEAREAVVERLEEEGHLTLEEASLLVAKRGDKYLEKERLIEQLVDASSLTKEEGLALSRAFGALRDDLPTAAQGQRRHAFDTCFRFPDD